MSKIELWIMEGCMAASVLVPLLLWRGMGKGRGSVPGKKKVFHNIPTYGIGIPLCIIMGVVWYLAYWRGMKPAISTDPELGSIGMIIMAYICVYGLFIGLLFVGIQSVVLYSRRLIIGADSVCCKSPFFKPIEIRYDTCYVGIEPCAPGSIRMWWVCISNNPIAQVRPLFQAGKINKVRFSQDFIRAQYSDELYEALLEVLPKKQAAALQAAKRWMDAS